MGMQSTVLCDWEAALWVDVASGALGWAESKMQGDCGVGGGSLPAPALSAKCRWMQKVVCQGLCLLA